MTTLQRILIAAVATGSLACATAKPAGTASAGTSSSSSASAIADGRWSGSFKQTQMPTGQLGAAAPNRGYGTITISKLASGTDNVRIEVSVNAPVAGGTQIAWAVFNGACGSAAPMVTGENRFPPMEIAGGGQGFTRVDMQLPLDARSEYHANVYWTPRARDLGDVMMCAPLKFGGR
jgi:hypothetical protein